MPALLLRKGGSTPPWAPLSFVDAHRFMDAVLDAIGEQLNQTQSGPPLPPPRARPKKAQGRAPPPLPSTGRSATPAQPKPPALPQLPAGNGETNGAHVVRKGTVMDRISSLNKVNLPLDASAPRPSSRQTSSRTNGTQSDHKRAPPLGKAGRDRSFSAAVHNPTSHRG